MKAMLALSRVIDAANERLSLIADALVFLSCLISAGNAFSRYAFSISSNAWLEIQWYMFGALVMLGTSYTLTRNEHVRVDIVYTNIPTRWQIGVDIFGGILFLLPAALIMAYLSWPIFHNACDEHEMSGNAGGLVRWPIKIFLPLGFALLSLQGFSELIKRIAMLTGHMKADLHYERPLQGTARHDSARRDGAILGAITGTVAASVVAMGLISLPVMMRYGYDQRFATGVIAASGTITQLIPPSLVLIVLADQLGRSVGDMYAGAWGPSLVQVLLFSLYVLIVSFVKPEWVPGIPVESRTLHGWPLVKKCLWGIVPSLVLIFLVLGTIFLGLATPTQGGAMGMVGAIVLAVLHRPEFSRQGKIAAWIALVAISIISLAASVAMAEELAPALAAAASGLFDATRAPLFIVFYAGLALVMWEAVRISDLRNLISQA